MFSLSFLALPRQHANIESPYTRLSGCNFRREEDPLSKLSLCRLEDGGFRIQDKCDSVNRRGSARLPFDLARKRFY
jgi:hypothetical protein